jgi:hypothetical protein
MNGVRRRAVLALASLAVVGSTAVGTATSAEASAYGCTGYGWQVGTYRSQFCGQIDGSGTYVRSVGAGFSAPIAWAGTLQNTRVKIEFVDTRGVTYWTLVSGQQNGYSSVGAWSWTLNTYVRTGTVRYTLLSNGAAYAVVQHTIR